MIIIILSFKKIILKMKDMILYQNVLINKKSLHSLQTELTIEILKNSNNFFVDIGSHGYYSLIANALGNEVLSIDKNDNYLNLLRQTINENNLKDIEVKTVSIDDINSKNKLKLIKILIY